MTTKAVPPANGSFVAEVEAIRQPARQHIEDGAVTNAYKGNREAVIKVLNEAIATQIVCVLRYKRHYYTAKGIHSAALQKSFLNMPAKNRAMPIRSQKELRNSTANQILIRQAS